MHWGKHILVGGTMGRLCRCRAAFVVHTDERRRNPTRLDLFCMFCPVCLSKIETERVTVSVQSYSMTGHSLTHTYTGRRGAAARLSTFPIKLSVAYYSCLADTDMFPPCGQTNRAHMGSDIRLEHMRPTCLRPIREPLRERISSCFLFIFLPESRFTIDGPGG